jgi:FAD/FMN-containing dehydrogenase
MVVYKDREQPPGLTGDALTGLRERLQGRLLTAGDADYEVARRTWNHRVNRFPGTIAQCLNPADIVIGVAHARAFDLLLAVRGGGHDVAGNGMCDDGLVLDLSRMKGIQIDPVYRTARVEPGVVWGELDAAAAKHSLALTGGQISSTGVAGLTLGGGLGWLMRDGGLTVDSLVSLDVVNAEGELLTVNASSHPDLFWALRGGGGNFGVVTSFEFQLRPLGQIIGGTVAHPVERAVDVLEFFSAYAAQAADELTPMAYFFTAPDLDVLPAPIRGRALASIAVCYTGDHGRAEPLLASLKKFGPPLADRIQAMPYTQLQQLFDAGSLPGFQNYWRSWYLRPLSAEAIATIADYVQRVTSPLSIVLLTPMGGAVRRVPADATAFGHRDAALVLEILAKWDDPAADATPHVAWADAFFEAMRPFSTGGSYLNFLGDEGDERIRGAFSPSGYARLAAIKHTYDPTNFFRVNQNIPSAPGATLSA